MRAIDNIVRAKVRDLLPMHVDIDVCDDVCEELYIAFCGPVTLTDEGMDEFGEVLGYPIEILENPTIGPLCIVHIDDDNDRVWERRLRIAKRFFYSAAGYCADEDYTRWFKQEEDDNEY